MVRSEVRPVDESLEVVARDAKRLQFGEDEFVEGDVDEVDQQVLHFQQQTGGADVRRMIATTHDERLNVRQALEQLSDQIRTVALASRQDQLRHVEICLQAMVEVSLR